MPTFRRRPVQVEAITAGEVRALSHRDRPRWVQEAMASQRLVLRVTTVVVRSPGVDFNARPEDWIVRDPDGELSGWRPVMFEKTFQPA